MILSQPYLFEGTHVMADLYGVPSEVLNDLKFLSTSLTYSILDSGATLLTSTHYRFNPTGLTILLLLSESHVSLHTYPTQGNAFFDTFTCGNHCKPEKILETFCKQLGVSQIRKTILQRGDVCQKNIS